MKKTDMQDTITQYCKILRLPQVDLSYEDEAIKATKTKMSYQEYLYSLLQHQVLIRTDNSINAKIKKARFPFIKTLEEFDFSFEGATLSKELIQELIFAEMCHFHEDKRPELVKMCESRGRSVVDGRVILDAASLAGKKSKQ